MPLKRFCPYCGSEKIHPIDYEEFECEDCQQHWQLKELKPVKEHPDSV